MDKRVTAVQLISLKDLADGSEQIARLLGVARMPRHLQEKTRREIAAFLETGDATIASQLIHASTVRRKRSGKHRAPTS